MRFYKGSHEYLYDAFGKDVLDQCLFLVADAGNEYDNKAISLHNGQKKLGSVSAEEAPVIWRMLEGQWKHGSVGEDVFVCEFDKIGVGRKNVHSIPLDDFEYVGHIKVRGMYRVHERLARKFSDQLLKR